MVKDPNIILKSLSNISTIPTLPSVLEKINRLLNNPQTSAEEIGKVITTDQALSAKVLKLVNSAFYGFPGKIGTITHAVVILGFTTIKNIILTASIFDVFTKKTSHGFSFDLEKFWLHSIACGAASQCIAKHIGFNEKEECFVAGLIHDVGKIILCNYLSSEFELVLDNIKKKNCLFYESEKEILGLTHEQIGGIITEKWNLPKNLQDAVKKHHSIFQNAEFPTTAGIVHAADILVRAMDYGNGGDNKLPQMSQIVWKNLGLESLDLIAVLEDINEEVEKANVFMQLI